MDLIELKEGPISVQGHTIVEYKDELYLFGGRLPSKNNEKRSYSSSLYKFIPKDKKWEKIEVQKEPEPRHNHSCVVFDSSMYIFGGSGYNGFNKEFLEYKFEKNEWRVIESKNQPRFRHAHTAVLYKKSMILFGGHHTDFEKSKSTRTFFNDVHFYDFEKNEWTQANTSGEIPKERSWYSCSIRKFNDNLWRIYHEK